MMERRVNNSIALVKRDSASRIQRNETLLVFHNVRIQHINPVLLNALPLPDLVVVHRVSISGNQIIYSVEYKAEEK